MAERKVTSQRPTFFQVLLLDPRKCITVFLCWADVMALCDVWSHPPFGLREPFADVVKRRMGLLGLDTGALFDLMLNHGFVITGSFLHSCLYSETYPKADLDMLYVDTRDMKRKAVFNNLNVTQFTYEQPEKGTLEHYAKMDSHLVKLRAPVAPESFIRVDHPGGYDIKSIAQGINIDLLELKEGSTVRGWLDKYVDISFCKMMFDGKKLHMRHKQDIIHRRFTVNFDLSRYQAGWNGRVGMQRIGDPGATLMKSKIGQRIMKYRDRGFRWVPPRQEEDGQESRWWNEHMRIYQCPNLQKVLNDLEVLRQVPESNQDRKRIETLEDRCVTVCYQSFISWRFEKGGSQDLADKRLGTLMRRDQDAAQAIPKRLLQWVKPRPAKDDEKRN